MDVASWSRSGYGVLVLSIVLATLLPKRAATHEGGEETVDETILLGRIVRGDTAAYRALYDRLGSQSLALAIRVLGARTEAEDTVQETFLDVWTRAAQFDPVRGSGRAWVLSMVRNRAIDRLRTRDAVSRMIDRAESQQAATPRASDSPSDELTRAEAQRTVQVALSELAAPQRHALELAYFEGLSQSEIAERLGEPLGTVKSRVRAAMEKLAQLVRHEGDRS